MHLVKRLGAFEVFTISSGTMIGAGIFVLPGILASKVGPASILCFIMSGAIALCAGLSISELATAMPKSGGSYYFVSRAMGGMFGSIVGWGTLLALIFKGSFAFMGAGEYLHELVTIAPMVTALALCVLMVSLNIAGTEAAGRFQNLMVSLMLTIFTLFVLHGIFSVDFKRFEPFFRGTPFTFFEATGMVFITFLGVLHVTAVSEEVKNPSRDLPLGIVCSLAVVTSFYALIMMVTVGVLPIGTLSGSLAPIADAARVFAGTGGMVIIVLCGLMATLSTGNTALMSSSRYPFAMARDKLMPGWLAGIDRSSKTPARAILFVGLITFLLILFVDIENMVKLGSVFNLLVFIMVNTSVLLMRTSKPKWYRPGFRAPLYPWVQVFGIGGCLSLIPFMGTASIVAAGLLVLIGSAWFFFYGRGKTSPAYRLRDVVRTSVDEEESRSALRNHDTAKTHSWRLMVPVVNSIQQKNLLRIADLLSEEFDERVHLVYFRHISDVSYIGEEDIRTFSEFKPEDRLELPDECNCARFEYTGVCTSSMSTGFAAMAEAKGADLAVMALPDPADRKQKREMKQVIGAMPCNCALYIERELPDIRRILVAAARPEDRLKLTVAGAVAKQTGATVTVLRVVPSRAREVTRGDLESRIMKSGILHGIPLESRVVRSDDVPGSIMSESSGYDLLITGSAHAAKYSRYVMGRTSDELMKTVECPVIFTVSREKKEQSLAAKIFKRLTGSL